VPADHPLRKIRSLVDSVLKDMSPPFGKLYSDVGRPSIAPERLLRALLLQIFYSVRSERLLMEQLDYNLLFRWFVGMNMTSRCGWPQCSPPRYAHSRCPGGRLDVTRSSDARTTRNKNPFRSGAMRGKRENSKWSYTFGYRGKPRGLKGEEARKPPPVPCEFLMHPPLEEIQNFRRSDRVIFLSPPWHPDGCSVHESPVQHQRLPDFVAPIKKGPDPPIGLNLNRLSPHRS
jgi:hypothetical protein